MIIEKGVAMTAEEVNINDGEIENASTKARIEEAKISKLEFEAEKAREERDHEKDKREKTKAETERTKAETDKHKHSKWIEYVKVAALVLTAAVGATVEILKHRKK